MLTQFSHTIARWILDGIGSFIVTIKILVKLVHSAVPIRHTIRVKHGNQDKDKIFSEQVCSVVIFIKQKLNNAFHAEAGRGFNGVDSGADKDDGFIISELD